MRINNVENYASAWRILLDCGVNSFPVPAKRIANFLGIPVLRYSRGEFILREIGVYDAAMQSDAITIPIHGKYIILYDDDIKNQRARVAIGHEIGHIMLDHLQEGCVTTASSSAHSDKNEKELTANLWCEQLLAPTGVLLAADITTRSKIERICEISRRGSDFVLARLGERKGYCPTHPDEIELVRRFKRSL